jgi:hypothetical protein
MVTKEITRVNPPAGTLPLALTLVCTLDRTGKVLLTQLGEFPDSIQLALLILSLGQASNWVIPSQNVQVSGHVYC